jgi:hypothetical protein
MSSIISESRIPGNATQYSLINQYNSKLQSQPLMFQSNTNTCEVPKCAQSSNLSKYNITFMYDSKQHTKLTNLLIHTNNLPINTSSCPLHLTISHDLFQHIIQLQHDSNLIPHYPITNLQKQPIPFLSYSSFNQLMIHDSPINDSVIYACLQQLTNAQPGIRFLDTFFYTMLVKEGWQAVFGRYLFTNSSHRS